MPCQFIGQNIVPGFVVVPVLEFAASLRSRRNPSAVICVCYRGTGPRDKVPASIRPIASATGELSMVITSAHISPIIALIAGVLILLMPRLLNLVVAIYLICIGLIGLGVLRLFHM
jgi:hypothetical protein